MTTPTPPANGDTVALIGLVSTDLLRKAEVKNFIWSAFYAQYVTRGYAQIFTGSGGGAAPAAFYVKSVNGERPDPAGNVAVAGGSVSNPAVAAFVTAAGPTKSALDGHYAPVSAALPSGGSTGQLLAKTADGTGWTDAAAGGGITQSAADGRYSQSVYLRDFVSQSNTTAQNRTGYIAAIAAAAAGSKRLCYDGAYFTYAGATVIDTNAGMVHWASSWSTHLVRQEVKGHGILRLAGPDSLAENLNVDGMNDNLDFTGVTIGGTGQFRHSVGVRLDPTAHRSTLRNIRGKGLMHVTVVSSLTADELVTSAPITARLKDCVIDGVYSDGCWAALQYFAPQGLRISGLTGTYSDVIGSGGEAHLLYGSGYGSEYALDVSIDDCECRGGKQHGSSDFAGPYKISRTIGLSVSNLRARDCPGLISVEYCSDFEIGPGVIGVRDTTTGTAPMVQFFELTKGSVAPLIAKSTAQLAAGATPVRIFKCQNVDFAPMRISVAPATVPSNAILMAINGDCTGTRIREPELSSEGAAIAFAMTIAEASGSTGSSSGVVVDDPKIVGVFDNGIRMNLTGATVRYRGSRISATGRRVQIDNVASAKVINLDNPSRIDTHPRALGWHYGEQASASNAVATWPSGQQQLYRSGNNWAGNWAGRITETSVTGGRRMFVGNFAADAEIAADIRLGTGTRAGFAIRAVSDVNYLAVARTAGAVKIFRCVSSDGVEIATAAVSVPDGAFANIRVVVTGAVVLVLVNGVQAIAHTLTGGDETTYVSAAHGLYGHVAGNAVWENPRILSVV